MRHVIRQPVLVILMWLSGLLKIQLVFFSWCMKNVVSLVITFTQMLSYWRSEADIDIKVLIAAWVLSVMFCPLRSLAGYFLFYFEITALVGISLGLLPALVWFPLHLCVITNPPAPQPPSFQSFGLLSTWFWKKPHIALSASAWACIWVSLLHCGVVHSCFAAFFHLLHHSKSLTLHYKPHLTTVSMHLVLAHSHTLITHQGQFGSSVSLPKILQPLPVNLYCFLHFQPKQSL